jgi:hypothetical protein
MVLFQQKELSSNCHPALQQNPYRVAPRKNIAIASIFFQSLASAISRLFFPS